MHVSMSYQVFIIFYIYFVQFKNHNKVLKFLKIQRMLVQPRNQIINCYNLIISSSFIITMSHPIIKRKRTESLKSKIYSQQSGNIVPRHSLGRILNDSLSKRRRTTHNSPDKSQEMNQQIQTQIQQAKQIYRNQNTKNALVLFRKLYKKYPNNSQIPYYIGSCLLNENSFEPALTYFRACLLANPNFNKNIYICIAICNKALGNFHEALQILDLACEKYIKFNEALFYKAKIHMKQSQFQLACQTFRKCIKNDPRNVVSYLFLADCLKNMGKYEQAIEKYNIVIREGDKLSERALLKKIGALVDWKKINQAQKQINKAYHKNIESHELNFYKGVCEYDKGNYNDAITLFELSLASNIGQANTLKSLKYLMQIRVKEKDFFGAEHLVTRSKFMNINQKQLLPYYKLVEGINDLIKRRLSQSEQKLQEVYTNSLKQSNESQRFIYEASSPYYAFCLFNAQKYEKSLETYRKLMKNIIKDKQNDKRVDSYNSLVCEGIVLHKKNKYKLAEQKFRQASKHFKKKVEPVFLICVNLVQEYKQKIAFEQELKTKLIDRLSAEFKMTEESFCHTPLFLFYMSLTYLYQGKDARSIIDRAINLSEQEVSQYFFIQALSYSVNGQNIKGLESITKAIDLDHNIPQFYKERSKYFYVLERYQQAVSDVLKIMEENQDEEAKLLLTFYYYMTNQIAMSLQILKQVSQHCSQDKFKQFQTALYFRLHLYDKCGVVGTIIDSIIKKKQLSQTFLESFSRQYIKQRQPYSQFTVYHFYLILAAYYFYNKQLDVCLQNLFGALQELQLNSELDEYMSSANQMMLNQIKFNIAIASLLKQVQQKQQEGSRLDDTFKYIEMFISETEDIDFIKAMNMILVAIDKNNGVQTNKVLPPVLDLYSNQSKLSDDLPEIQLFSNYSLRTKFLITYPLKLKFNISPQFDQSFLYNFDVDKVQSKLCPPWFKLHQGHIFFTDKIRNESVMISETQRAPTPSLLAATPIPQNLKQKFKLDDAVEKKLQRFIHTRKKKEEEASKTIAQKRMEIKE